MFLKNISFAILLITTISCKSSELLPGYILNSSPNSADKPGRIYRLDNNNKTDILVQYLDVNPEIHPIYIPEKNSSKSVSTNALVSFISKGTNTSNNAEININKKNQFDFRLKDTKVIKLSDEELRPLYSKLIKQLTDDIKLFGIKTPKYFIVREAITAKEMIISFTKSTSNKAEIKAKLNTYINNDGTIQWTNNSKEELNIKLNQGVFVFFKPEEILFSTSIGGDTKIIFSTATKNDIDILQAK